MSFFTPSACNCESIDKLLRFTKQGLDPVAILDQSTVSGWTDVYEPNGNRAKGTPHKQAAPIIPFSQQVREQRGEA